MKGEAAQALDILSRQYTMGADPSTIVADLLELSHWLTRVRVVPASADDPTLPEAERVRGKAMAETLPMAVLTRAWQILLKGLDEVRLAPNPLAAAEMVLIRLIFAADLPTPADALKALARITSYNVCYTKLLRAFHQKRFGIRESTRFDLLRR